MTIEERAYMAVGHPHNGGMHVPERLKLEEQTFVNGYTKGATDQCKIDIEKACEWLRKNCVGVSWIEDDVEMFRRAMEDLV